jgi:hypothetical protein
MKDLEAPIKKTESHPFHSGQLNNRKWVLENVKAAMTDFSGEYHIDHLLADHIAWYVAKNLPEGLDIQTAQIKSAVILEEYKTEKDFKYPRLVFFGFIILMFIFTWLILS